MNTQVADVFDDAADYIEANGWAQQESRGSNGEVCISTAIAVCSQSASWDSIYEMITPERFDVPAAYAGTGMYCAVYYNDRPDRTKQQVLDKLREIAKELRMPRRIERRAR